MTEHELLSIWSTARKHIVLAQLAPVFLLTASVWLLAGGLGHADVATRLAMVGILLAAGILGSLVEYSAATQAMTVATELQQIGSTGPVAQEAIRFRPWMNVVRFVTPAIFVLVFVAELWALFLA